MHGVLGRLPCDLQALVAERVRHEEHLHARLLLSSATRCIAGAATATDARNNVERAMAPWSAILDLGYFDDKIVRLSRIRQDAWRQIVKDPCDMRFDVWRLMDRFQKVFAPPACTA